MALVRWTLHVLIRHSPWRRQKFNRWPATGKPQSRKFWAQISSLYHWHDQHWLAVTDRARDESSKVCCKANLHPPCFTTVEARKWPILHRMTQQTGNHAKNEPNLQWTPVSSTTIASVAYLGCGGHWQTDRLCATTRCKWFSQNPQVRSLPWKSKVIFVTVQALQGNSDASNSEVLTALDNTCPHLPFRA